MCYHQEQTLNDVKAIFAYIYRVSALFHSSFAFPPEIWSGFCFGDEAQIFCLVAGETKFYTSHLGISK